MDGAGRLGGKPALAQRPGFHLVLPAREEVDQAERLVAGLDDLGEGGLLVGVLGEVGLERCTRLVALL
jgi:hypothetical protein